VDWGANVRKKGMHARLKHLDTKILGMLAKNIRRPFHTLKTSDSSG
jgi:hypothetical protein